MKRLLTILCIPAVLLLGGPSEGYAFDETDLQKLLAMNHCVNCDLRKANLKGADLRWADLDGADLSGTDLSSIKSYKDFLCYTEGIKESCPSRPIGAYGRQRQKELIEQHQIRPR